MDLLTWAIQGLSPFVPFRIGTNRDSPVLAQFVNLSLLIVNLSLFTVNLSLFIVNLRLEPKSGAIALSDPMVSLYLF